MHTHAENMTYRVAPGLSWVVENGGVQIVDEVARQSERVGYPEAVVWELLVRGHNERQAGDRLRWILGVGADEAHAMVRRCRDGWTVAERLVVATGGKAG